MGDGCGWRTEVAGIDVERSIGTGDVGLGAGEGSVQADVISGIHGHLIGAGNQTGNQGEGGEEGRKRFHEVQFWILEFVVLNHCPAGFGVLQRATVKRFIGVLRKLRSAVTRGVNFFCRA